jgi:hypothetical protein
MVNAKAEVKNLITFMSGEMSKVEEKTREELIANGLWGEGAGVNETTSKVRVRRAKRWAKR